MMKNKKEKIDFDRTYYCLLAIAKVICCIGIFTVTLPILILYLPISWYKPLEIIGNGLSDICEWVVEM